MLNNARRILQSAQFPTTMLSTIFILILSGSSFAQEWSWDQTTIDFSRSDGDNNLRNAELAIQLDGVDVPYFVYKSNNNLQLIYDENPNPGNTEIDWSIDVNFFNGITASDYWDVDCQGSIIRYSYLYEQDDEFHFRSLTKDYNDPDAVWVEDQTLDYDADLDIYDAHIGLLCRDMDGDSDYDWILMSEGEESPACLKIFYNTDQGWTSDEIEFYDDYETITELSVSGMQLDDDAGCEIYAAFETYYYHGGGFGLFNRHKYLIEMDEEGNLITQEISGRFGLDERLSSIPTDNPDSPVIFGNNLGKLVTYNYVPADSALIIRGLWSEPNNVMNLCVDETGSSPEYILTQDVTMVSGGSSSTTTYYQYDIWSINPDGIGWNKEEFHSMEYAGNDEYHQGFFRFDRLTVNNEETIGLYYLARNAWDIFPNFTSRMYFKNEENGNWEVIPGYNATDNRSDFIDMDGDGILERLSLNEEHEDTLRIYEYVSSGDDWHPRDSWVFDGIHHSLIFGDFDGNSSIDILSYDEQILINTVAQGYATPAYIREENPFITGPTPDFDMELGFGATYNWMPVDWDNDGDTDLYSYQNSRLLINSSTTDVDENKTIYLPDGVKLGNAYPNPFNPSTTIPFTLSKPGKVEISVFDLLGKKVVVLADESFAAGRHMLQWNTTSNNAIPSGTYFLHLKTNNYSTTQKLILSK